MGKFVAFDLEDGNSFYYSDLEEFKDTYGVSVQQQKKCISGEQLYVDKIVIMDSQIYENNKQKYDNHIQVMSDFIKKQKMINDGKYIAIDLETNNVIRFSSQKWFAEEYGVKQPYQSMVLSERLNYASHYTFFYAKDYIGNEQSYKRFIERTKKSYVSKKMGGIKKTLGFKYPRRFVAYNLTDHKIVRYDDLNEFSKVYGVGYMPQYKCLTGKQKSAKGYIFFMADQFDIEKAKKIAMSLNLKK